MSKIRGPFFSIGASGTIGKKLTMINWKGQVRARRWFKPNDIKSATQLIRRGLLFSAVAKWHEIVQNQQNYFNELARSTGRPLSGYNYFISEYMADPNIVYFFWPCESKNDVLPEYGVGSIVKSDVYNLITDVPGHTGSAVHVAYDASHGGSYFEIDHRNVNPAIGTVSFWFKPSYTWPAGSPYTPFTFGNPEVFRVQYGVAGSYFLRFYPDIIHNVFLQVAIGPVFNSGTWYFLKFRWNFFTKQCEFWIDGVKPTQVFNFSANWLITAISSRCRIGSGTGASVGAQCNGAIDDFKISQKWE